MPLSDKKVQNLKNELVKFVQVKQFKKAEKLYPRYKELNIEDADIWRYFAGVHSARGNATELINCCKKVLEINPDDSQTAYILGASLQNLNRLEEAIYQYESCIAINPQHADAIANCAQLYFLTGEADKSAIYYRQTLEKIDTPEIRMQYGQVLMALGEPDKALQQFIYILTNNPEHKKALFLTAQCYYESRNYVDSEKYYLKLLQLDRGNINAINNLGRLYEEAGKLEKAIEKYHEAIKINDRIAIIYINLGKVLVKTGSLDEAKKTFNHAMRLEPEHPEVYFNLGKIYNETNEVLKAKEHYLKALKLDIKKYLEKPDEFILAVKYFLAEIENPESFNKDKKAFVADLFDGYADKFDEHLVEGLQYKTPELINDLIIKYVKGKDNNTLDLGCGTGLCGKYLSNVSKNIIGVDLSAKMIDKAKLLNCYDQLIVGEITEVVNDLDEIFDLIVAADVFVYIGSLSEIFLACSSKIRKDSYYIFSTELLPDNIKDDYRLYDSGRYKHSTQYINKLLSDNEFELISHQYCTLRKENGKDVKGCVTTLNKI